MSQYHPINQKETDHIIANYIASHTKTYESWFQGGDSKAKGKLTQALSENFELQNAAMNQLYYVMQQMYGITMSFEDFLNTKFPFYRAASSNQKYNFEKPVSFSPDYEVIKKGFGQGPNT